MPLSQYLSVTNSSLVKDGTRCPLSLHAGISSGLNLCRASVFCPGLCEYLCVSAPFNLKTAKLPSVRKKAAYLCIRACRLTPRYTFCKTRESDKLGNGTNSLKRFVQLGSTMTMRNTQKNIDHGEFLTGFKLWKFLMKFPCVPKNSLRSCVQLTSVRALTLS